MAGTHDRRKAAKIRAAKLDAEQKLSLDQLEPTMEAKEIFARAFLGAGGLEALIDWIKQNGDNRGMFYSHYAKLIQQSVVTQVNAKVTVEDNTAAKAKFDKLIEGIVAMRMQQALVEQGSGGPEGVMMMGGVTYK